MHIFFNISSWIFKSLWSLPAISIPFLSLDDAKASWRRVLGESRHGGRVASLIVSLHVKNVQEVRRIKPRQTEWHTSGEAAAPAVMATSCHSSKEAT